MDRMLPSVVLIVSMFSYKFHLYSVGARHLFLPQVPYYLPCMLILYTKGREDWCLYFYICLWIILPLAEMFCNWYILCCKGWREKDRLRHSTSFSGGTGRVTFQLRSQPTAKGHIRQLRSPQTAKGYSRQLWSQMTAKGHSRELLSQRQLKVTADR